MARSTSLVGWWSSGGTSRILVTTWLTTVLIACGEPITVAGTGSVADQLPSPTNMSADGTTSTTVVPRPTSAPSTTSIPLVSTTADAAQGDGVLVNPVCRDIDTALLEAALGMAPIVLALDIPSELRGPGGVLCSFDVGRERSVLNIELWPPITDEEMIGSLEILPFASEGGMEVSEQNGVWIAETGDTQIALFKKLKDRWASIGLTFSPDREFPGLPGLEQALDVAGEEFV